MDIEFRHLFASQFLEAAVMFGHDAREIEIEGESRIASDEAKCRHKAYVTAAIMQSIAAVESEAFAIANWGPAHHLGSDSQNENARKFLEPLADTIDHKPGLERFCLILHLMGKPKMDLGSALCQDMALLFSLRNEITHYKSYTNTKFLKAKFVKQLQQKKFPIASWSLNASMDFPHKLLSAGCAIWAAKTAIQFLIHFYSLLGVSYMSNWDILLEKSRRIF